jgi:hypothetical protein
MRYESARKPKICPKCGSIKIAKILYGMPAGYEELMKKIEEGKIVLGGCCITNDDPTWQCVECETSIYKEALN